MQRLSRVFANGAVASLIALGICAIAVVGFSLGSYCDPTFLEGVKVEGHGMLMDLVVFGVFLTLLARVGEKHVKAERYLEEIDDLRGLQEPVAAHRLAGLIRRLNKLGRKPDDLTNCYLSGANLGGVDLSGCNLMGAQLGGSKLFTANLHGCVLCGAVLEGAWLPGADLEGVRFGGANLRGAMFKDANLKGADFRFVETMDGASLEDADLTDADFRGITEEKVDPLILVQAETLEGVKMDEQLQLLVDNQRQLNPWPVEARPGRQELFDDLASSMPDVIQAIKEALTTKATKFVREFVVLRNPREVFVSCDKKRFLLYEEKLADLFDKTALLEERGFIEKAMTSNVPIYRVSEEFVAMVKAYEG